MYVNQRITSLNYLKNHSDLTNFHERIGLKNEMVLSTTHGRSC